MPAYNALVVKKQNDSENKRPASPNKAAAARQQYGQKKPSSVNFVKDEPKKEKAPEVNLHFKNRQNQ